MISLTEIRRVAASLGPTVRWTVERVLAIVVARAAESGNGDA